MATEFEKIFVRLLKEREFGKISDDEVVEKFVAQCVDNDEWKAKKELVSTQIKHGIQIAVLFDLISEAGLVPKDKMKTIDDLLTKSAEKICEALWNEKIEEIKNQLREVIK